MKKFYLKNLIFKSMVLLVVITVLYPGTILAQAPDIIWTKNYGDSLYESGFSVKQTSDGGYIITGQTQSYGAGGYDLWIIKTDSNGDTIWTRTYGGVNDENGWDIQKTPDGGYIIAGFTASFGAGGRDLWLLKIDSTGDTLWTKTYGSAYYDEGLSVQLTSDGGYIIAGYYTDAYGYYDQVYLLKTDSDGNLIWSKTFGRTGGDIARSVKQTLDGGYIVTGYSYPSGSTVWDLYVIRTDSLGDTLWTRLYEVGDTGSVMGSDVVQLQDSSFVILAQTKIYGAGASDFYLMKIKPNGDTIWTRTYGGPSQDFPSHLYKTPDGGFVLVGRTQSFGAGGDDFYIIRTDSNGDTLWTKTVGGVWSDGAYSIDRTSDGGYIVVGYSFTYSNGYYDVYLVKLGVDLAGEEDSPPYKEKKEAQPQPSVYSSTTFLKDKIIIRFKELMNYPLRVILSNSYGSSLIIKDYPFTPQVLTLNDEKLVDLKPGVYFLSISSTKRKITRIKLIKP